MLPLPPSERGFQHEGQPACRPAGGRFAPPGRHRGCCLLVGSRRLRSPRPGRTAFLGDGPRGRGRRRAARRLRARAPGHPRAHRAAAVERRAREAADGLCRQRAARRGADGQHLAAGAGGARRAGAARCAHRRLARRARGRLLRRHLGHQRRRRAQWRPLRRAVVRRHARAVLSARPARRRRHRRSADALGHLCRRAAHGQAPCRPRALRHLPADQRIRAAGRAGAATARRLAAARGRALRQLPRPRLHARVALLPLDVRAAARAAGLRQRDRQPVGRVRARLLRLLHQRAVADRRVPPALAGRAAIGLGHGAAARPRRPRRLDRRRLEPGRVLAFAQQGRGLVAGALSVAARGAAALLRPERQPAAAAQCVGRRHAGQERAGTRLSRAVGARAPCAQGARVGAHRHRDQARHRGRDARRAGRQPRARRARPRVDRMLEKRRWMLSRGVA